MKPRRRWFQYSLRSFLVLLTALAVWLGVVIRRATEQREAVEAIQELGGWVIYDWEHPTLSTTSKQFMTQSNSNPDGPVWLRRLIGDDFFQKAEVVQFSSLSPTPELDILNSIPHLKRLHGLTTVDIWEESVETQNKLKAALPNCEVRLIRGVEIRL